MQPDQLFPSDCYELLFVSPIFSKYFCFADLFQAFLLRRKKQKQNGKM
jgi:hypothetical protein